MRKGILAVAVAITPFAAANGSMAGITEIRVDAIEPFAEGHVFGEAGAYLRIRGVAKGELDPNAAQNKVIVDLDKAPRNARGMVDYETDVFILRPADPARGSGIMLYEVNNRGRKFLFYRLDEAAPNNNDPKTVKDAGLGFSLGRGYTIVWSGWDPDAPKANNGLTARLPVATEDGAAIVRRIRDEIQIGTRGPADVEVARLSYTVASPDKSKARLTWRAREGEARVEVPADQWEFEGTQGIRLLPRGSKFTPIAIYDLWYEAKEPKVIGMGFAVTRDVVSFLRYERADAKGTPNPVMAVNAPAEGTGLRHALAFGISQSGRYLRHHIELGMNKDTSGRRVFDGVLSHTAGAGKVFANHTFAMPNRTATQHEDRFFPENWFPFSAAMTTDPFSGTSAALFKGDGSDPLLIETNTSTEYWQKGASLIHMDPAATRDVELPPSARAYLIAGTQHAGTAGTTSAPGPCGNLRNPHNPAPALRALMVALEAWVTKGIAPPASRVPTLAQGSAVEANAVKMPAMKGLIAAPGDNPVGLPGDWIDPPGGGSAPATAASQRYGTRVAAVDADGNEIAGIRLPDIAAPLATYTGWNVYNAQPGELCDRDGSSLPFAKTKAEREAAGDSRLSLEERYGSREAYAAKVKAAADALVAERLLLPADAARYGAAAQASDRF